MAHLRSNDNRTEVKCRRGKTEGPLLKKGYIDKFYGTEKGGIIFDETISRLDSVFFSWLLRWHDLNNYTGEGLKILRVKA